MKLNKKTTILALTTLFILLLTTQTYAVYQTVYGKYIGSGYGSDWIKNIRKMETEDQGMGLTETIDETTLESTSGSNNIDVHMIKNTEYGALAILSASTEYGKQPTEDDKTKLKQSRFVLHYYGSGIASTTGNVYGVYMNDYAYTQVAASTNEFSTEILPKYINIYRSRDESSAKVGDATTETRGWHRASYDDFVYSSNFVFRNIYSMFDYSYGSSGQSYAAVVNGQGL